MRKNFLNISLIVFFLFSVNVFSLDYAKKNYTTSFWSKVKGVASWIYYQWRLRGNSGGVVIPIRIWLGYGYDWALIYWNSGYMDWTFTEGENNRCGRIGYYNLTSLNVSGSIVRAYPKVPQPYYSDCGGFFWNNRYFLGRTIYDLTAFNLDVSTRIAVGSGVIRNPDDANYYRFSLLAQSQYLYTDLSNGGVVNLPPSDLSGKNFLMNTNDFLDDINTGNPHDIDTIPYIPETREYLRNGFLDGRGDVVGSSSTYTIDDSSYTAIVDTIPISSVQYSSYVYVVNEVTVTVSNIDLSTTNQKLSDIYNFLTSTSDETSYDTYFSSISYATSTINNFYNVVQNFFTSVSSDTWDCSFHFGTMTFLSTQFDLGSVNLCSHWGWAFSLLRSMLKLGAFVFAYYILAESL